MIARFWLFCSLAVLSLGGSASPVVSQDTPASLRLWTDAAPGARGDSEADIPTLTPFLPETSAATGAAIVICPGGGYGALAEHEGATYAQWFRHHGIAAFVLRYRLGSAGYRHPVPLSDAARAIAGEGVGRRSQPHRDHRFVGRWPSGRDAAHALGRG